MAVHYRTLHFKSRDKEEVSNQIFVLLYNIHKYSKIDFDITEGHRTLARQAELVKEKGLWSPSNPTGAAAPSPRAPHIRTGRPDHAIDAVNAAALVEAMRRRGVRATRPLAAEPWHIEINRDDLKKYYDKKAAGVWKALKIKHNTTTKPAPKPKNAMTVSSKGIEFIAHYEGGQSRDGKFRPYRDAVGVWTIGYGHTEGVGPNSKPLTKAQALSLLKKDVNKKYAPPVANLGKKLALHLKQHELDALVSLVYNVGPGILDRGRSIGDAMRAKDRKKIASAILLYNKAGGRTLPGLVARRKAERHMFLGR